MNALIYNNQIKIEPTIESVMLHCAYILLNKTIATGSTRQYYHLFLKKSESLSEKLKFLESLYKAHDGFDDAKKALKAFKDFKKFKHPPAYLIIAHKKLQKAIEAEYENQTGSFVQAFDELRLISIDELAPHGYFDWFYLDDEQLRVPNEQQKHVSAQEMLQLLPEQLAGEPFLFVLPDNLFKKTGAFGDTYCCDAPLPPSMENISFLHTCFELPNVLLLSCSEVHTVKMQLQASFDPFNKAMDQWLHLCNQNGEASSTIDFFRLEVLPAAQSFQAALHNNAILNQHSTAGNDKQKILFSLGEMSLCEVWRLLRQNGLIPWDDVWNEMTALMEEPRFKQPRPVLLLSSFSSSEEKETDGGIPFKKKSLNID